VAQVKGLVRLASVPVYFGFKIASAIFLLKICASYLTVRGYGEFAQLVQFGTLLNLLAVAAVQNGLIRQSAAAERDEEELAGIHGAALIIWAAAALLLLPPLCLGSRLVSSILVGSPDSWSAVIAITALSLTAGPGQIWCSILSGRKRVATSLVAQASGLCAGVAIATVFVVRGEPQAAATAFSAGPLLTLLVAAREIGRLRLKIPTRAAALDHVVPLIRYSTAFGATSGYTALVLFGLRSVYRHHFGATALGYWIAANRISDMSTQLLGLFFIQFYVSHVANLHDEADRRAFVVRCWAAGAALMTFAFLVFWIAGRQLVPLFLSSAFLPATPIIQTYLLGDVLTVWAALAMYTAFARGRPAQYAAIEMATVSLMAVIAMALIAAGDPRAPQLAYVSAYAVTAIVVTIGFAWTSWKHSGSPTARRTAFTA
jgi:O-antigen/teichoic acid export membrane protein